ncbi:MAG: aminotransferase class III-fold pyridoxal phosphate-dependent enzyme, partial [Desulfurococcales archaeon]|nr:aminotransferase class III-fold pyridoxal phosphate-dependent enzyme [Desulfurococcales archaeon]
CGLRGMQEYYGVNADLVTLGKAIANGLPVAALGGRREIMEYFESTVITSGTYAAHPISMAGGVATIKKATRIGADKILSRVAEELKKVTVEVLSEAGLEAAVSQFGGSLSIHLGLERPPRNLREALKADQKTYKRLAAALRERGVLVNPNPLKRLSTSTAHDGEAIEYYAEALRVAVKEVKR